LKKKNTIYFKELTNNLSKKKFSNIFVNQTFYQKELSQKFTNVFLDKNKKFFDLSLIFLSEKLNKIHSCKHNYDFWKIILGNYIHIMVNIIINRMNYIENLNKKDVIILKKVSDNDYITENIQDFEFSSTNDCFNNAIYYFLLKIKKKTNFKLVKKENLHLLAKISKKKTNFNSKFKFKFKNLFRYFSFDKEVLFYNTNFNFIKNFRIYKKFNFFFNIEEKYKNSLNKNLRNINYSNINNKQEILNYFLLKFIPKAYLENFKYLYNNKLFRILSKNTKIVITENAHISDEEFKFWLAKNNDKIKKIKLVQIQGGAGYNYLKNEGTMAHRSSIADYLFSWGKKNNYKKRKQIYIGYPHNLKIKHNNNNKILYVCNELPRYLKKNASIPEGQKFIEHINLHEFFFKNLSKDIS
jgi:putative transferase (TIGR04331 family)